MNYLELLQRTRGYIPTVRCLCLDPGETTGVAVFRDGGLISWSQAATKDLDKGVDNIEQLLTDVQPDIIVMEDYKVYDWKTKQHAWAALHTPQLLGVIHCLARLKGIPIERRMAFEAKTFCTDTKLIEWNMYKPGMRHARDAIRHGCFAYLFSKHPLFKESTNGK